MFWLHCPYSFPISLSERVEDVFDEIEKVETFVIELLSNSFLWEFPLKIAFGSFGQEFLGLGLYSLFSFGWYRGI